MNLKALHRLGYGLYIVSSKKGDRRNGQIANTVFQITAEPPTIAVSINNENLTHEFIKESKVLAVSILAHDTPLSFISASMVGKSSTCRAKKTLLTVSLALKPV